MFLQDLDYDQLSPSQDPIPRCLPPYYPPNDRFGMEIVESRIWAVGMSLGVYLQMASSRPRSSIPCVTYHRDPPVSPSN